MTKEEYNVMYSACLYLTQINNSMLRIGFSRPDNKFNEEFVELTKIKDKLEKYLIAEEIPF